MLVKGLGRESNYEIRRPVGFDSTRGISINDIKTKHSLLNVKRRLNTKVHVVKMRMERNVDETRSDCAAGEMTSVKDRAATLPGACRCQTPARTSSGTANNYIKPSRQ
jgi:hypothetical protein